MLFQFFRLNFSEDMSKMHYFSNKFSKIAKRYELTQLVNELSEIKEQLSINLRRIAATSMPEYVSGWCGHGFKSHSQPFLLTYPEADLSL